MKMGFINERCVISRRRHRPAGCRSRRQRAPKRIKRIARETEAANNCVVSRQESDLSDGPIFMLARVRGAAHPAGLVINERRTKTAP